MDKPVINQHALEKAYKSYDFKRLMADIASIPSIGPAFKDLMAESKVDLTDEGFYKLLGFLVVSVMQLGDRLNPLVDSLNRLIARKNDMLDVVAGMHTRLVQLDKTVEALSELINKKETNGGKH